MNHLSTIKPLVGVGALCSPLEVGAERGPQAVADLAALLQTLGCAVVNLGVVDTPDKSVRAGRALAESHVDAVALVSTSWYEDYLVLDLLEECSLPVLLWSLPGMETGALCGHQQLTSFLKPLGVNYRAVFGPPEKEDCRTAAKSFLQASALKGRLRRARIGLLGHRVSGMTEVAANEFALKKAIGPRVVPLDVPQCLAAAKAVSAEEATVLWRRTVERSGACRVPKADGLDAMRTYVAIKALVAEHGLSAAAVGCYPHLMGKVCLAASLLADEGVPLACEGDINGAVGQLILTLLTGQPTHNTDWLEPMEDGTVVLTHCGCGSFSLADPSSEITLAPVRLMDQGVCALFPAKPGPVTLVNLIPHGEGYQLAVLTGQAVSTGMVFPGNPLRVRFEADPADLIDWIHAEGIGHHWMAGYGHTQPVLRNWAQAVGKHLRFIEK